MPATYSIEENRVLVTVRDKLSYEIRHVIRSAREAARKTSLPLSIDIRDCARGDMGGLWEVMKAGDQLPSVELCGCHGPFVACFDVYGVCGRCSQTQDMAPDCPRNRPQ